MDSDTTASSVANNTVRVRRRRGSTAVASTSSAVVAAPVQAPQAPRSKDGPDEGVVRITSDGRNGGAPRRAHAPGRGRMGPGGPGGGGGGGGWGGGHHRRRRFESAKAGRAWIIAAVVLTLLSPAAWSYGAALAAPGNVPLSVRSVEWLRDHHGRWLVNDVEDFWYNHHKPKKGGQPAKAFAGLGVGASGAATGKAAAQPTGPKHLPPPAAIAPIVSTPLAGEGQWQPLGQPVDGIPAMYYALLRPDPVYTSVVAAVAWMDPTLVKAVLYAGVQEPGGGGWRYQAPIAPADRPNLLAAFNSGFKMSDALGGYYADGRTARPLRAGAATLAISTDGTPTVGQWGRDIQMGPDIAYARQNLALIVDGGQPVPDINRGAKWGATVGNKVLVWRSGVGVTANGALVYAGGNNLSASTLAQVAVS